MIMTPQMIEVEKKIAENKRIRDKARKLARKQLKK